MSMLKCQIKAQQPNFTFYTLTRRITLFVEILNTTESTISTNYSRLLVSFCVIPEFWHFSALRAAVLILLISVVVVWHYKGREEIQQVQ